MIKYEYIIEAQEFLVKHWEDDGKKVIEECARAVPYNDTVKVFLKECTPCGGNWGGMMLTGIRKCWPEVWKAIPEDMGIFAWNCLIYILLLCGVDTTSEE